MITKTITVEAPCTIANVGAGFDVLGLAVRKTCDRLTLSVTDTHNSVNISQIKGADLTTDPHKNVASKAILAMQAELENPIGVDMVIEKLITPGSGLGSSAASAVAAVFAYNECLEGQRFSKEELIAFALEGEALASGSKHADNIAPALLGGVCLIQGQEFPRVTELDFPSDMYLGVVFPQVEIKTSEAREILTTHIPFHKAIQQWGSVGGLVAGFMKRDKNLIAYSLEDVIVMPQRAGLIPHFQTIQAMAKQHQTLGMSISGSGPTMFAVFHTPQQAQQFVEVSQQFYHSKQIETEGFISSINPNGVTIK